MINMSRQTIDVAMFSFTSGELAQGLAVAHHRGLRVRVILDANQSDDANSEYRYLTMKGVSVKLASGRPPKGIMHHKFAIFDGREIATGSYNWTRSAEQYNYEHILFLEEPKIVESFVKEFEVLWSEGRLEDRLFTKQKK